MKKLAMVVLFMLGCGANDPSTEDAAGQEANAMGEQKQTCDRDCLIAATQALFEHPERGKGARLTENGQEIALADSWLTKASGVQFHNAYADEQHGQVLIVGSASGGDKQTVFGLRAKLNNGEPEELEMLVTHEGEASLFPP